MQKLYWIPWNLSVGIFIMFWPGADLDHCCSVNWRREVRCYGGNKCVRTRPECLIVAKFLVLFKLLYVILPFQLHFNDLNGYLRLSDWRRPVISRVAQLKTFWHTFKDYDHVVTLHYHTSHLMTDENECINKWLNGTKSLAVVLIVQCASVVAPVQSCFIISIPPPRHSISLVINCPAHRN